MAMTYVRTTSLTSNIDTKGGITMKCIVLYTDQTRRRREQLWMEFDRKEDAADFIRTAGLETDKSATVILLERPRDRVPVPDFLRDVPQTVPDDAFAL